MLVMLKWAFELIIGICLGLMLSKLVHTIWVEYKYHEWRNSTMTFGVRNYQTGELIMTIKIKRKDESKFIEMMKNAKIVGCEYKEYTHE